MKNVSRRDILKLMGVSAGALAANAVLGSMPAFAGNRSKELNILCWEGYNSAEVLDPFRALTKATIKAESLTNDPTMINRLRGGETKVWDLINVNNPWARKIMAPAGLIKPLPRAEFEPYFDAMLPQFKSPYKWALSEDGKDLLGMAQRFGPFNYVVNTKKISRATAEDTGWDLFNDPALSGKYGIQESDDWNVSDIFLIAGINPFVVHTEAEMAKFEQTAIKVFKGAKMVSDVASLNQAMVAGEIDFYMTGGTYTASPARADGFSEIRGITPLRGPVNGKGGVSWVEVTSVVNNPNLSPLAYEFLKYVQDPKVAHRVAFAEGTFNPVSQMGNPECFKLFSSEELDILQWDSLDEEMARCVEYDIVPEYDQALEIISTAKRMR
jgi:spermidine/putrescine transport system substrate-binding protein